MKIRMLYATILILAVLVIHAGTVNAVTKIPTPTPTILLSPTQIQPEDGKVQEIRQAIKEKVTLIKDKMDKRAFVGTVKEISGQTIVITNTRGQQRLDTDETTTFIASNKKEVRIKDLVIGDKVIALGILTNTNNLQAFRITLVDSPKKPLPLRYAIVGSLLQVDPLKSSLSFASEGLDASTKSYKIDKNSKFSLTPGEPLKQVALKQLPINKRAVLVYQELNKVLTLKSLFYLD